MFTLAWGVFTSLFNEQTYKVLIIGLESSGKTTLLEQIKCTYSTNTNNNNNNNNISISLEKSEGVVVNNNNNNIRGIPTPAPISVMLTKRIRPTIGLNMSRIIHRTIPSQLYFVSIQNNNNNNSIQASNEEELHSSVSVNNNNNNNNSNSLLTYSPTNTHLVLWDVGGAMRTLWANYFASCHGVIFVVDSTLGENYINDEMKTNNNNNNITSSSLSIVSCEEVGNKKDTNSTLLLPLQDMKLPSLLSTTSYNNNNNNNNVTCNGNSNNKILNNKDKEEESQNKNKIRQEKQKQLKREAYAKNSAVLREVFCHPLLSDAPLLIVSNKSDINKHSSLAELQEGLGLVEIALMHQAYNNNNNNNNCNSSDDIYSNSYSNNNNYNNNSNSEAQPPSPRRPTITPSSSHSNYNSNSPAVQEKTLKEKEEFNNNNNNTNTILTNTTGSSSGIGSKRMRIMEISALSGVGVREAMDWLVIQMKESGRVAEEGDG